MQQLPLGLAQVSARGRQDSAQRRVQHRQSCRLGDIGGLEAVNLLGGSVFSPAAPATTLTLLLAAVIDVTATVPLLPAAASAAKQSITPGPARTAATAARKLVIIVITILTASRAEAGVHVRRVAARPRVGVLHLQLPIKTLRGDVRVEQRHLR
jgi:hypothetical protein